MERLPRSITVDSGRFHFYKVALFCKFYAFGEVG